jgi:trehalose/maltose hydrolase-like predicted phosphorylase
MHKVMLWPLIMMDDNKESHEHVPVIPAGTDMRTIQARRSHHYWAAIVYAVTVTK